MNGMKEFWCVVSRYFDSGKVKTMCFSVEATEKPENSSVENRLCDEYRDYFDTYEEAKEYERDCWRA